MLSKEITGRYRSIEIDLADNPIHAFNAILNYWELQRGSAFAPTWANFHLIDLPPQILPYAVVADLRLQDDMVSYRYYGSGMATIHGFELTNKTSNDIEPAGLREHIVRQYRQVAETRAPQLFATEITVKKGVRLQHLVLRLPLSDDGVTVDRVFTAEDEGDHGIVFD